MISKTKTQDLLPTQFSANLARGASLKRKRPSSERKIGAKELSLCLLTELGKGRRVKGEGWRINI